MKNLLKTVKKAMQKEEWYSADMLTAKGEPYRRGVKAINKYEAAGKIVLNMPKGSVIVDIRKGEL